MSKRTMPVNITVIKKSARWGHFLIAVPLLMIPIFILPAPVYSGQLETLGTNDVAIFYEQPLKGAAQEIAEIYPGVRKELETAVSYRVDFRPAVVLVSDEEAFEQITGNRLIVAYAVPEKMLIVINHARSSKDPFSTRAILKHELCHLLLHRYIHTLPRWLDEGVSQWVSGGFAELFSEKRESYLRWASISGGLIEPERPGYPFPAGRAGTYPGL